jgi:hypothetical protein
MLYGGGGGGRNFGRELTEIEKLGILRIIWILPLAG